MYCIYLLLKMKVTICLLKKKNLFSFPYMEKYGSNFPPHLFLTSSGF